MLFNLSMIPIGKDVCLSDYVAKAVSIIKKSGLEYEVNDFGTVIRGNWDKVMPIIRECREEILKESNRVYTTILIDERKDKDYKIGDKRKSVEKKLY